MKAMILAAGRGERLRPLTDVTPKPLIQVAGRSLIEYHIDNLAAAGFSDIIINTAWLAEKIHHQIGDGSRYGVNISYSDEGEALETAGGIINALPLIGDQPFLVVNGDIWCDFRFSSLPSLQTDIEAHLVLVNNPEHNPEGDFSLRDGLLKNSGDEKYTYSGIGIFTAEFFAGQPAGKLALAPVIRKKCELGQVSGQTYDGIWTDVGTLDRLAAIEQHIGNRSDSL